MLLSISYIKIVLSNSHVSAKSRMLMRLDKTITHFVTTVLVWTATCINFPDNLWQHGVKVYSKHNKNSAFIPDNYHIDCLHTGI